MRFLVPDLPLRKLPVVHLIKNQHCEGSTTSHQIDATFSTKNKTSNRPYCKDLALQENKPESRCLIFPKLILMNRDCLLLNVQEGLILEWLKPLENR